MSPVAQVTSGLAEHFSPITAPCAVYPWPASPLWLYQGAWLPMPMSATLFPGDLASTFPSSQFGVVLGAWSVPCDLVCWLRSWQCGWPGQLFSHFGA